MPDKLSLQQIIRLKKGEDLYDQSGNLLYTNTQLTLPPKKSRSYAYCSDTKYHEAIIEQIAGVDVLYHESTFLEKDSLRAGETFHCTTTQAAAIAKSAGVQKLLLGHFSARYKDLTPFLDEASQVFTHTQLALEGEEFVITDTTD